MLHLGSSHLWILTGLWAIQIRAVCRDLESFAVNELATQGVSILTE